MGTLSCEKFVFGGCDGNGNNFGSRKKCEKKCSYLASQRVMQFDAVENEEEEEEVVEEPVPEPDVCTLPKEMGRCRARFNRFYFNEKTGDCEAFVYGGCEGNGNNFQSIQLCRQKCIKNSEMVNDAVEPKEEEPEEPEKPAKKQPKKSKKPKIPTVRPKSAFPTTDACSLPKESGFCRGYFPKFFFNDESIFGRVFENIGKPNYPGLDNEDEKPICEQPI